MDVNGKLYYSNSELPIIKGLASLKVDLSSGLYFVQIINSRTYELFLQKLVISE